MFVLSRLGHKIPVLQSRKRNTALTAIQLHQAVRQAQTPWEHAQMSIREPSLIIPRTTTVRLGPPLSPSPSQFVPDLDKLSDDRIQPVRQLNRRLLFLTDYHSPVTQVEVSVVGAR
jgi:hypothetical protein